MVSRVVIGSLPWPGVETRCARRLETSTTKPLEVAGSNPVRGTEVRTRRVRYGLNRKTPNRRHSQWASWQCDVHGVPCPNPCTVKTWCVSSGGYLARKGAKIACAVRANPAGAVECRSIRKRGRVVYAVCLLSRRERNPSVGSNPTASAKTCGTSIRHCGDGIICLLS